ncbi:MAG TPA: class I SAM-dependent methyltransferase [Bacteroidales bacterium]|nr:class I SAM-dependent methyltransferase [Bacteroidales bacterium]
MSVNYPASFARFYDTIYHHVRDSTDHEYFMKEIRDTGGKVLEAGAGTGRLFSDALDHRSDIYGLDISESMIGVLRSKLPEDQHYRISLQNIVNFTFNFKFDLIIAPFRVFMHLLSKEEQISALNNVYNHLNPNGRFIFDTFIPDLNQIINGLSYRMDFEGEYEPGKKIRRFVSTKPSLIDQTIQVEFHLEWEEENRMIEDNFTLPMRFYFRYELEHLVERSLFRKYQILGDYQGNELSSDSKDFIVICQKTQN